MKTATVSKKGWIVIPAEIRKEYNLQPGDRIAVVSDGHVIQLVPVAADPVDAATGLLQDMPDLLDDLLTERRKERENDERTFPRP